MRVIPRADDFLCEAVLVGTPHAVVAYGDFHCHSNEPSF